MSTPTTEQPAHSLTQAEAARRAELLTVGTYDLALDLTGERTFTSRVSVDFTCTTPGADTWIDLASEHLVAATLNGVPLSPAALAGDRLALTDLQAENTLVVDAVMTYPDTGEGLYRFTDPADGAVYVTSQCAPMTAHRVHACFDQPDLKASWRLAVTVPEGWTVLANGAAQESGERWRFTPTERMASYLLAVCAGPWHTVRSEHDGIALSLSCRASLAEHLEADSFFEVTRQSFDHYHRLFGSRYPFTGGYDQVYVPDFNWGAMENPGCVTYNENYLFRSRATRAAYQRRAEVIAHEMAHMWFGNLVTMRWWDDTWLNESFATYMSAVVLAEATEFDQEWTYYALARKARAAMQDQLPSTHPVAAEIPDLESAAVNFDGITYDKGASVLKQLVAWVGREEFLAGLRAYFDRYAFGSATLADLLAELEAASGRDLAPWARLWLQTSGVNTLRPEVVDGAVEVRQTGEPLRPHRVAVGAFRAGEDGRLSRVGRVEVDVVGARTPVPGLPADADLLLVNDDDLTYAKLRLDARSEGTTTEGLSRVVDPLARAVLWTGAWDAVRDAELTARRWLALVESHVDVETDVSLLQWLQGHAVEALDLVCDAAREDAAETLAASSWQRAAAAAAGSDAQLSWLRTWASASGPADGERLCGLLAGDGVPPGLAVDTELRWHLLLAAVRVGAAAGPEVDAELAADRTAAGERQAATCRAAIPTAEAKAAAWAAVTASDDLPKAAQAAVLRGFHARGAEPFVAPYAREYAEVLAGLWEQRATEKAMLIASEAYPHRVVAESTVALMRGWLDAPGRPAACARLLGEGLDGTLRTLRARAADA